MLCKNTPAHMSRGVNVRKGRNYFFRDSGAATATETVMPTMGLLPLKIKLDAVRNLYKAHESIREFLVILYNDLPVFTWIIAVVRK